MDTLKIELRRELKIEGIDGVSSASLTISGTTEARPGQFSCEFTIPELEIGPHRLYGGDALQAFLYCVHTAFLEIQNIEHEQNAKVYWLTPDDLAGLANFFKDSPY